MTMEALIYTQKKKKHLVLTNIAMEAIAHRNRWFTNGLPINNDHFLWLR